MNSPAATGEGAATGASAAAPDFLPNFFIAGGLKAGTSSLHRWLADHPEVLGSREKETFFFADPGSHSYRPHANAALGLESWRDQFVLPPGPRPKVIFESSVGYLYSATALAQVPALPTRPKVLFVLREPADQVRSLYTYFRTTYAHIPAAMGFAEFLAAVRSGRADFAGNEIAENAIECAKYARWLDPWHAALGDDRMRVRSFDDLRADPAAFTRDLAGWLGIDPGFYDDYDFPLENESYVPRSRLLQRVNIALRDHVPKGRIYDAAKRLYRGLATTRSGAVADPGEAAALAALRAEFAPANAELAARYGVRFGSGAGEGDTR